MLDDIKKKLGINFIEDTEDVLQDIIDDITSIACNVSNRDKSDEKLIPYIKRAATKEYLARGNEGLTSRTEGSISSAYEDIIEKLRNDIIKNGVRRLR